MRTSILIIFLVILAATGCGPRVPRETVGQVTWQGEFKTLQADPAAYQNEFIIIGGTIIRTENYDNYSEIKVLQYPLDGRNRPITDQESEGRFLVRSDTFVDPETHFPGKPLTVAGRVIGAETRPIGDHLYQYPIIEGELFRWEVRPDRPPRFHFGIGVGKTF
jgi:outer membrane lipoprotein